jgi:hypothetical protein
MLSDARKAQTANLFLTPAIHVASQTTKNKKPAEAGFSKKSLS